MREREREREREKRKKEQPGPTKGIRDSNNRFVINLDLQSCLFLNFFDRWG